MLLINNLIMRLVGLFLLLHSVVIDGQLGKIDVHHRNQRNQEILTEGISLVSPDGSAIDSVMDISELHQSLSFHPPSVDFGVWSIGVAQSHIVTLVNKNENRSVYLSSVSGKTPDFYSSFFQDKVVPPQGNTSFNVVFLPRSYGEVETNLLIHTSFGQAKLFVRGEGRECPYRLKPLVGIRAPLNSTLAPEIHMYNPHSKPLQILEVYSSGGQFQLELPSGGQEGPQDLWEIPPHSTKPVIRIRFSGVNPGNHTAYIRIKIAGIEGDHFGSDNILMIPVEFEILTTYGLYSPMPVFDFGRLTTQDEVRSFKVELKNSGKSKTDIIDYELRNVEFPIYIEKNTSELIINPKWFTEDVRVAGELVVKTVTADNPKETRDLILYIRAEIFCGSLEYNKNVTTFITKSQNFSIPRRNFYVRNTFSLPVAILNVSIDANISSNFRISNFIPIILQPGESLTIFEITLLDDLINVRGSLNILTNMTTYQVPVIVCTGLLKVFTVDSDSLNSKVPSSELNLGTIPFKEMSHWGYIVVENRNPISLEVSSWDFSSPQGVYFLSMLFGCLKSTPEANILVSKAKFEMCFKVEQNEIAVYGVSVQSHHAKASSGSFQLWTEHEHITVSVKFNAIMGRLEIDQKKLQFINCFPGTLCSADIAFLSSFNMPMRVNSITFSDANIQFVDNEKDGSWIMPQTVSNIGKIYYDPRAACSEQCYISFNETLPMSSSPETHLSFDEMELRKRTDSFRLLKYYLKTLTFTVNTSEVRALKFNLTIDIIWPKLVNGVQNLPTTELGQLQISEIEVHNPSDSVLVAEFFLSNPEFSKNTRLSLPKEVIKVCQHCYLTDKPVFNLRGVQKPIVIQPQSNIYLQVEFMSKDPGMYSTILHIRNNLTLYEAVWITAKAVQSQFKFGNKQPGLVTTLNLEIGDKHLSLCMKAKEQDMPIATISTKRTFTARNTGESPISIETFMIGNQYCEGYGFKIGECQAFELKANSSRKVDVIFTPDFTMSKVVRPLVIRTNLSHLVNYTLVGSVTPQAMEFCSGTIPRPSWEIRLKQIAIFMLATAFIFVVIACHLDSDKVLNDHVHNISREKGPIQPTLNLRHVAMQSNIYEDGILQSDISKNNRVTSNKSLHAMNFRKRTNKKPLVTGSNPIISPTNDRSWAQELVKLSMRPRESNGSQRVAASSRSPMDKLKWKSSTKPLEKGLIVQSESPENNVDKDKLNIPKHNVKSESNQCEIKKTQKIVKKSKAITNSIHPPTESVIFASESLPAKDPVDVKMTDDRATPQRRAKSPKTVNKTDSIEKKPDINLIKPQIISETSSNTAFDIMSNVKTSNGSSAFAAASAFGSKKYGKTPGRERKKDQTNGSNHQSKRYERKVSKFKPNAFHFSSPLLSKNDPISFWELNQQASFSDVVASPSSNMDDLSQLDCEGLISEFQPLGGSGDWNDVDLKNDETFGDNMMIPSTTTNGSNTIHQINSNELGPIGTKRSPSSTPNWEPFNNLDVLKPTVCNNSSFFSNIMPSYMYSDANQYLGRNSATYNQDFTPSHLQSQWNPSSEFFESQQQQQQHQHQMSESQKNVTTTWGINGANGGCSTTQTWDPMGYGQSDNPSSWQNSAGIRPPPGMDYPKLDSPLHTIQQPLSSLFGQQMQHQDPDPPFNPIFSTLSTIWSDNWINRNRNTNNGDTKNHSNKHKH